MAKWQVGTMNTAIGCRFCGNTCPALWTDTGTNEFFLECCAALDEQLEDDSLTVDLDRRQSMWDLRWQWTDMHTREGK